LVALGELAIIAGTYYVFHDLRCERHPGANAKRVLDGVDPEVPQVCVEGSDEVESVLEAGGDDNVLGIGRVVSANILVQDISANQIFPVLDNGAAEKVRTITFECLEDLRMIRRTEFSGVCEKRLVFGIGDVGMSFTAGERVGGDLRASGSVDDLDVEVSDVVVEASKTAAEMALGVEIFERFVIGTYHNRRSFNKPAPFLE
jgi:hypothetical protein